MREPRASKREASGKQKTTGHSGDITIETLMGLSRCVSHGEVGTPWDRTVACDTNQRQWYPGLLDQSRHLAVAKANQLLGTRWRTAHISKWRWISLGASNIKTSRMASTRVKKLGLLDEDTKRFQISDSVGSCLWCKDTKVGCLSVLSKVHAQTPGRNCNFVRGAAALWTVSWKQNLHTYTVSLRYCNSTAL